MKDFCLKFEQPGRFNLDSTPYLSIRYHRDLRSVINPAFALLHASTNFKPQTSNYNLQT
jgi:hypothetical protein